MSCTRGYILSNVVRQSHHCENTTGCVHTNLEGGAFYTLCCVVQPVAPGLQTCGQVSVVILQAITPVYLNTEKAQEKYGMTDKVYVCGHKHCRGRRRVVEGRGKEGKGGKRERKEE